VAQAHNRLCAGSILCLSCTIRPTTGKARLALAYAAVRQNTAIHRSSGANLSHSCATPACLNIWSCCCCWPACCCPQAPTSVCSCAAPACLIWWRTYWQLSRATSTGGCCTGCRGCWNSWTMQRQQVGNVTGAPRVCMASSRTVSSSILHCVKGSLHNTRTHPCVPRQPCPCTWAPVSQVDEYHPCDSPSIGIVRSMSPQQEWHYPAGVMQLSLYHLSCRLR
jgi:hypothetical protein